MVYEVAWSRALSLVLASSVYAFTVVLSTVLLGLAAGSYLGARQLAGVGTAGVPLALCQLGIGLTALGGLAALPELPYLFLRFVTLSGREPARLYALEVVIAAAVLLGPAVCLGAVFPLAVRLTGRPPRQLGSGVGTLYALNSAGAVVGSFVGGFVLLPGVGIRTTILRAVLLNIVVASVLLLTLPGRRRGLAFGVGVPLLGAALGGAALTPPWPREVMTRGVAVHAPRLEHLSRQALRAHAYGAPLIFYEEGLTTTVSVERRDGVLALRVDGKPDASTGGVDMANQVLLGHLPLLFHADPRMRRSSSGWEVA
jgi:spermidine synthase